MSNVPPLVKKNKKKKKKKSSNPQQTPDSLFPDLDSAICQYDANKENFSITEILPNKVGMKAFFNDVEVTMTSDGKELKEETKKKKKKKKKAKQQSEEQVSESESVCKSIDQSQKFFKFNESHIELLNHPEISVTKVTKPKEQIVPKEEQVGETKSKKKKNKNKKQGGEQSTPQQQGSQQKSVTQDQEQNNSSNQSNQTQKSTVTQNNQKQETTTNQNNQKQKRTQNSQKQKNTVNQNNQKQATTTQNSQKQKNSVNQNNQKQATTTQNSTKQKNPVNQNNQKQATTTQNSTKQKNPVNQNNQKQATTTQNSQKQKNSVNQNNQKQASATQNSQKQKNSANQNNQKQASTTQNSQKQANSIAQTNQKLISAINNSQSEITITPVANKVSQPSGDSNGEAKKKKNKKKKKKKTESNSENPETTNSADQSDTPTYVKLPGAGDNFVLLVSHQNFANPPPNPQSADSSKTILIQSKERKEQLKNSGITLSPVVEPISISMPSSVIANPIINSSAISNNSVPANSSASDTVAGAIINNSATPNSSVCDPIPGDNSKMNSSVGETPTAGEETKTKAQLKAERRALQEAQRAAKLAKTGGKDTNNAKEAAKLPKTAEKEAGETANKAKDDKPKTTTDTPKPDPKPATIEKEVLVKPQPFSHLPPYQDVVFHKKSRAIGDIHPSVLEVGSHFHKGSLSGSNARCVAFLAAFQDVVRDCRGEDIARELESQLQKCLSFLSSCRPLSSSIQSASLFLRRQISHLAKDCAEEVAKHSLISAINSFVQEEILLADEAISQSTSAKIVEGDNILVAGYSSVVRDVLKKAHEQGKRFTVTVVNAQPRNEGLTMLRHLSTSGIRCVYTVPAAVSYCMHGISKVMVGTHALLSNGRVTSRCGYKQIATAAASHSIPVVVCCETYKFCDRAVTDSFAHNELGDPKCLKENGKNLQAFNVEYDVTPMDLIAAVHTEKGILPCTSVPVVLRVKHAGLQE